MQEPRTKMKSAQLGISNQGQPNAWQGCQEYNALACQDEQHREPLVQHCRGIQRTSPAVVNSRRNTCLLIQSPRSRSAWLLPRHTP